MNSLAKKTTFFTFFILLKTTPIQASCFDIDEATAYRIGLSKEHLKENLKELVEADQMLKNLKGKSAEAELKRRVEHSQKVLWAHVRGRHSSEEIQRVENMAAKFNEFQKGQITLFRFVMQDIGRMQLKENIAKGIAPPIEKFQGVRHGVSQEYIQYANVKRGRKTSNLEDFESVIILLRRAGFNTVHVEPHYPFGADQGYSVINEKITNPDLAPKGKNADKLFASVWRRNPDMNKWIDFVPSHVDRHHDLVKKALSGNKSAQDRIVSIEHSDLIHADRFTSESGEVMVRYKTKQGDQVITTERGLEFSGMRETHLVLRDGTYYHHSFTPQQFDLVGHHEMNILMTFEFVNHWMSKGVYGIRADAVPFWFKPWGTTGKHEAQSRAINEFYLDFVRGINPKAEWIPEVVAGKELANQYAGTPIKVDGRKTGSGATTINNFELGMLFVHGTAMNTSTFLKNYLQGRRKRTQLEDGTKVSLPEGVNENYVVTKHDQHDLGFIPGNARKVFQKHLYDIGGGVSSDGWSGGGRLFDIMKGNVQKIGMLIELVAGLPGSVNLLQGDMLGVRSNWPYHWEQANFRLNNMKENNLLQPGEYERLKNLLEAQPKNKPPHNAAIQKIVDIRDVHRGPVSSELIESAHEGRNEVFERVKDILPTKAKSDALSSLIPERMIEPTQADAFTRDSVLSYVREIRRENGSSERILVVGNMSGQPQHLNYKVGHSGSPKEIKGLPAQISTANGEVSFVVPAHTCYWIRL